MSTESNGPVDAGFSRRVEDSTRGLDIHTRDGSSAPEPKQHLPEGLEARVARLEEQTETEFIRRETRFIPALIGLMTHARGGFTHGRGRAALTAFLWRVFSPGVGAAAAGGVFVMLLTAVQVLLIFQQNKKLDQQTHLMQSQANVTVATQVGDLIEKLTTFAGDYCLVQEREPGKKCWLNTHSNYRQRFLDDCFNSPTCKQRDLLLRAKPLPPTMGNSPAKSSVGGPVLPAPRHLEAQIVTLTVLARPYRFIDAAGEPGVGGAHEAATGVAQIIKETLGWAPESMPTLTSRALSPERGVLLAHMITLGFDIWTNQLQSADFSSAYIRKPGFRGAHIVGGFQKISMPFADLTGATLHGFLLESDFVCGKFVDADLLGLEILDGDYRGADFDGATLPTNPLAFRPGNLKSASFENARVPDPEWLKIFAGLGVPGFDAAEWTLVASNGTGTGWLMHRVRSKPAGCQRLTASQP